jgi:excisionase family DNA binding protein
VNIALDPADVQAIAQAVVALLKPAVAGNALLPLERCGPPVRTLRAAIKRGELAASKVGRGYLVSAAALAEWLEARRVTPRAETLPEKPQSAAERAIERARRAGSLRAV